MNAILMVANRNVTLRTIMGSQTFVKDIPTLVAPQLVKFALEIGILPADGQSPINEKKESEKEPVDQASRGKRISDAIEHIYTRNDPDDFTTGATPKLKSVATQAGLAKVSIKEVKDILDARNKAALEAEMAQKAKAKTTPKAKATKAEVTKDSPDNDL